MANPNVEVLYNQVIIFIYELLPLTSIKISTLYSCTHI